MSCADGYFSSMYVFIQIVKYYFSQLKMVLIYPVFSSEELPKALGRGCGKLKPVKHCRPLPIVWSSVFTVAH